MDFLKPIPGKDYSAYEAQPDETQNTDPFSEVSTVAKTARVLATIGIVCGVARTGAYIYDIYKTHQVPPGGE